ncbi:MAG TPA: hypothetical protein DCR20_07490, partial [Planctomycetaceae bacterium]|nr:hypothetical protein [Planctomycetaceae bacterium]
RLGCRWWGFRNLLRGGVGATPGWPQGEYGVQGLQLDGFVLPAVGGLLAFGVVAFDGESSAV